MSTVDYKALAERVAQRAIYADNNADPNNKTWAADLRAIVSLLNGMAEAQPVAWRCEVRGDGTDPKLGAVDWRHYATTTNESNARAFLSRCGDGIEGRAVPLYPHPAPAAPQAEPCIGNDPICPCQDGDACHYTDSADGTKAWPVPQSEPKREPLSDEQIDAALQSDPAMVLALMSGEMTVGEFKSALRRLARTVERAHEIGGSDAE